MSVHKKCETKQREISSKPSLGHLGYSKRVHHGAHLCFCTFQPYFCFLSHKGYFKEYSEANCHLTWFPKQYLAAGACADRQAKSPVVKTFTCKIEDFLLRHFHSHVKKANAVKKIQKIKGHLILQVWIIFRIISLYLSSEITVICGESVVQIVFSRMEYSRSELGVPISRHTGILYNPPFDRSAGHSPSPLPPSPTSLTATSHCVTPLLHNGFASLIFCLVNQTL